MNCFPIIICSKGRPDSKMFLQLIQEKLEFYIVVEPQDFVAYTKYVSQERLIVLDANNQGLWYARNAALDYAKKKGWLWFWTSDDDIKSFVIARNGRNVTVTAREAILEAQAVFIDKPNIALASINFQQYTWSARKKFSINKMCDNFVAVNMELAGCLRYRKMDLKVDRDFTLQVIAMGAYSMLINYIGFVCPKEGSNKGGLYDIYNAPGVEEKASKNMVRLWGDKVCKFNLKDNGRPDVKIDASELNK